jgi:hypothetical protein
MRASRMTPERGIKALGTLAGRCYKASQVELALIEARGDAYQFKS